ncbi:hypothetical protein CB1_001735011 [Camelus ferus]|nr:hypothetical protein CB1_001735011 [Camelus ferus]
MVEPCSYHQRCGSPERPAGRPRSAGTHISKSAHTELGSQPWAWSHAWSSYFRCWGPGQSGFGELESESFTNLGASLLLRLWDQGLSMRAPRHGLALTLACRVWAFEHYLQRSKGLYESNHSMTPVFLSNVIASKHLSISYKLAKLNVLGSPYTSFVKENLITELVIPEQVDMALLSSILAAYSIVSENPERAALYFVSGVCIGLVLTLAALVIRISCHTDCQQHPQKKLAQDGESSDCSDSEDGSSDAVSDVSVRRHRRFERTLNKNVFTSAEELERAQRLEERERIIREIWMNGQPEVPGTRSLNRYY